MLKKNEWRHKIRDRGIVRGMYHAKGNPNNKRPFNAVYFSSANSVKHELHKAIAGLTLNKYGIILDSDKFRMAVSMLAEIIEKEGSENRQPQKWFITEAQERKGAFNKDKQEIRDLVILDDHTPVEWETTEERALRHGPGVKVYRI